MWNIDLIQIQQYYEKQVIARGSHIVEGEDKKKGIKKVNMIDVLCMQK
jgi:hypothetical protein